MLVLAKASGVRSNGGRAGYAANIYGMRIDEKHPSIRGAVSDSNFT